MSDLDLMARNASLAQLTSLLQAQHVAKLDVVTPARQLAAVGGDLRVLGVGEARIDADGVSPGQVLLRPTAVVRLDRADYLVVQKIYYPGFTLAGVPEIPSIIVLAVSAALSPLGP